MALDTADAAALAQIQLVLLLLLAFTSEARGGLAYALTTTAKGKLRWVAKPGTELNRASRWYEFVGYLLTIMSILLNTFVIVYDGVGEGWYGAALRALAGGTVLIMLTRLSYLIIDHFMEEPPEKTEA